MSGFREPAVRHPDKESGALGTRPLPYANLHGTAGQRLVAQIAAGTDTW